jgi:S-adenosylmethionine:tRNA ribosyltransferase-isomerase
MLALDFQLPPELEATEPPEVRGRGRDDVRLLVTSGADGHLEYARFADLGRYLRPGDVLGINTSGTMNAALPATRADGTQLELHLSTHLPAERWTVELRLPTARGTQPFREARAGESLALPAGATVTILTPHSGLHGASHVGPTRLWLAALQLPIPLDAYLAAHGYPIRYGYVARPWPTEFYQTVYATEVGSAEMPSAGRAFTPELITQLVAHGVQFAPLVLHTGVSSLEDHEPPYEEYYRVPLQTARLLTAARADQRRIIAVGTTVVRALETVTDADGVTHPGEGWTDLVVTAERGIHAVGGMLTGLHEPRASHLAMLEALESREQLRGAYESAVRERYLWHEFGDLHLLLP